MQLLAGASVAHGRVIRVVVDLQLRARHAAENLLLALAQGLELVLED